jgi:hypothetical protein
MNADIESAINDVATTSLAIVVDYVTTFWPLVLGLMFLVGIVIYFKRFARVTR